VKPRKQCKKCPWKVGTNPNEIPNGYSVGKHCDLKRTIATADSPVLADSLHVMACHETSVGQILPCVGWLVHQMGPGNNFALRLRVVTGQIDANVQTVGPQHERFEDTLPRDK
jgi:hypothetical protein